MGGSVLLLLFQSFESGPTPPTPDLEIEILNPDAEGFKCLKKRTDNTLTFQIVGMKLVRSGDTQAYVAAVTACDQRLF